MDKYFLKLIEAILKEEKGENVVIDSLQFSNNHDLEIERDSYYVKGEIPEPIYYAFYHLKDVKESSGLRYFALDEILGYLFKKQIEK